MSREVRLHFMSQPWHWWHTDELPFRHPALGLVHRALVLGHNSCCHMQFSNSWWERSSITSPPGSCLHCLFGHLCQKLLAKAHSGITGTATMQWWHWGPPGHRQKPGIGVEYQQFWMRHAVFSETCPFSGDSVLGDLDLAERSCGMLS
jgi:hypothetical protein